MIESIDIENCWFCTTASCETKTAKCKELSKYIGREKSNLHDGTPMDVAKMLEVVVNELNDKYKRGHKLIVKYEKFRYTTADVKAFVTVVNEKSDPVATLVYQKVKGLTRSPQ